MDADQQETEKYLQQEGIYFIFERLMRDLLIHTPADPISFLIKRLEEPEQKLFFIVGPPGFNTKSIGLFLSLDSDKAVDYNIISAGELVLNTRDKKLREAQHVESTLKEFRFAKDEFVIQQVKKNLEELKKTNKHIILVGFPRTLAQGLAFQKAGIIPDAFIVLNKSEARIQKQIYELLRTKEGFNSKPDEEIRKLALNSQLEYSLSLAQVKKLYQGQYFCIDVDDIDFIETKNPSPRQVQSLDEVALLINSRVRHFMPKRPASIFILGCPGAGRTTVGKALAKKYGLVFISTAEIIANDIAQGGERIALGQVLKGESVPQTIMRRLLMERLHRVDCRMCGFVLDGFPKTSQQFDELGEGQLQPTLLIILNTSLQVCTQRLQAKYSSKSSVYSSSLIQQKMRRWHNVQSKLAETERKFADVVIRVQGKNPVEKTVELISFRLEHS